RLRSVRWTLALAFRHRCKSIMWSVVLLCCTRWPGFRAVVVAVLAVLAVLAVVAACAACAGCGEDAPRVRVAPLGGDCARPDGGNLVKVTAFTGSGEITRSLGLDET